VVGDAVGPEVVGEPVGETVGSEVVGDNVGIEVVGETVGDRVGVMVGGWVKAMLKKFEISSHLQWFSSSGA
jgi:hypothetical protein